MAKGPKALHGIEYNFELNSKKTWMKVLQIIYYQVYNIAPLFLGSYYNSKNEVKILGTW